MQARVRRDASSWQAAASSGPNARAAWIEISLPSRLTPCQVALKVNTSNKCGGIGGSSSPGLGRG
eukprot:4731174-Prymnesium_polylepis.2